MSPRLDDATEPFLRGANEMGNSVRERASGFWSGFADFALRDNVLEVAVGLIIASTFEKVVSSFVTSILLPPVSLLPFLDQNLDEKFAVLRPGAHAGSGYNTSKQAVEDGAVVMAYGSFLSQSLNFIGIALALFGIAKLYEVVTKDKVVKRTVKCKYCRKRISEKVKRCINCTSWQDGREEKGANAGAH